MSLAGGGGWQKIKAIMYQSYTEKEKKCEFHTVKLELWKVVPDTSQNPKKHIKITLSMMT